MLIYPDMTITGSHDDLMSLLTRLDGAGVFGRWTRDIEAETSIAPMLIGTDEVVRCFKTNGKGELPSAHLWLDIGKSQWKVTNIVPSGSDRLSAEAYQLLLISFRESLQPMLDGLNLNVSEPVSEVGPEHWLSPGAVKLLHSFSVLANKSTGASHPRDRARWNAFVIEASRSQTKIGSDELIQILVEHEHWPEEKATELAIRFENETALLSDLAEIA